MTTNLVTEIDDDEDDCLDICTYCGDKYNPDSEGHTELDENEEETGNLFCSPECEMNHYRGEWHSHN
jgi:hypothetical protein